MAWLARCTDTIQTLFDEGVISSEKELKGKTAQDVLDGIAKRLRDRQDGPNGDHAVWVSLAERLDQLRERTLSQAQDSLDFLRDLFKAAKDLHAAEKVEDENGRDGLDLLPDPRIGALTQIFNEYAPKDTPVIVGRVVKDIDDIVKEVRYDGWKATQQGDRLVRTEIRKVLKRHALLVAGELFDRAYEYIAEHY